MTGDPVARFWAKVDKRGPDECWPWNGTLVKGHGQFSIGRRRIYAHRFALELSLDRELAPGALACHTCDNGRCVNPSHVYEGTPQTNVDDMWARQRARTCLGISRPDVVARHRRAMLAAGTVLLDDVDWDSFATDDRLAAQRDVDRFVRSVAL